MRTKTTAFYMKASKDDKNQIALLAKSLRVSKTEAVMRAVAMALETTTRPRRDLRLSPRKTARPSAAMNVQAN